MGLASRGQHAGMPRPVRARKTGELGVMLCSIGLQGGQERPLGIEANSLGSGLAQHAKVVDPDGARSEHLKPQPRRIKPAGRQVRGAYRPGFPRRSRRQAPSGAGRAGRRPRLRSRCGPGNPAEARKKAWMNMLEALLGTKSPLITDAGGAAAVSLRLPWPEWGLDGSMAIVHLGPAFQPPPASDQARFGGGSRLRVCGAVSVE